ncbi:MAG: hypothetical protein Q4G14_01360 [Paracoccus sp. (in: a-proteobacteria)]|uniref:hypothetical protein n=1 Tax=Paracoccus sp. TaxID=267 RepID=UPI0026DFF993|nr:hypothetical protein [Paracoccus sp. (in: a-proteobacteria)]MDO5611873.1 hypothetical protein [Paracoccus sp. (in: a-proteobacteria)]
MSRFTLVAAVALTATTVSVTTAQAKTLVTGGDVTVELTYSLSQHNLWGTAASGSPAAYVNSDGNPVLTFPVQATRNGRAGPWTSGSQVLDDGYQLYLNGGVYLYATDAAGNELESFDADGNRTCCRNALSRASGPSSFSINTVTGEVNAQVNGVSRDGAEFMIGAAVAGGYELLVTESMAGLLNYAYSEYNSQWFPLYAEWIAAGGSPLALQAGDRIGTISYDIQVAPVPVPAALPMLAGSLGLMGFVARRRRRNKAA